MQLPSCTCLSSSTNHVCVQLSSFPRTRTIALQKRSFCQSMIQNIKKNKRNTRKTESKERQNRATPEQSSKRNIAPSNSTRGHSWFSSPAKQSHTSQSPTRKSYRIPAATHAYRNPPDEMRCVVQKFSKEHKRGKNKRVPNKSVRHPASTPWRVRSNFAGILTARLWVGMNTVIHVMCVRRRGGVLLSLPARRATHFNIFPPFRVSPVANAVTKRPPLYSSQTALLQNLDPAQNAAVREPLSLTATPLLLFSLSLALYAQNRSRGAAIQPNLVSAHVLVGVGRGSCGDCRLSYRVAHATLDSFCSCGERTCIKIGGVRHWR